MRSARSSKPPQLHGSSKINIAAWSVLLDCSCYQPHTCNERLFPSYEPEAVLGSLFVAPSTVPTMLYLLEKKEYQSSNVCFSFSPRSNHSGTTSASFVDMSPRALEASLPAKAFARKR